MIREDERMAAGAHRYRLYGWVIASERPLPLLQPEPDRTPAADLVLRFGRVEEREGDGNLGIRLPGGGICLAPSRGPRFLIRHDGEIMADVPPGMSGSEFHSWLTGPLLGLICHLRGRPPLHAAGLLVNGRVVAISGHSGAGKSTLSRAMLRRGHSMLSDDQVIVDPETLAVAPGFASMKMWRTTAEAFHERIDPALQVTALCDKFHFPLDDAFHARPAPLALVILLERDTQAALPRFSTIEPMRAVIALHQRIYRPHFGVLADGGGGTMRWAGAVAARVPVQQLNRPDDLDQLDVMCAAIEARMAATGAPEQSAAA